MYFGEHEDAYRRLISLHARLGHRDAALRAYRRLQARLANLDLKPEPTTAALVSQIIAEHPAAAPRG